MFYVFILGNFVKNVENFFPENVLVNKKKAVPLHPISVNRKQEYPVDGR